MLTLDQITYNIHNAISGGRTTHNEYISPRTIRLWVRYYRSMLARRDLERNRRKRELSQELGLVDLSPIPEQNLYYTESLPLFLRQKDKESVTFLSFAPHGDPIQIIDNHSAIWADYNRFISNQPYGYVLGSQIYIKNAPDGSEHVFVSGVFEDPEEVHKWLVLNQGLDEDVPWAYPLPMDMVEQITKSIIEGEASAAKASIADLTHDTLPDSQTAARQG